LSNQASPVDPNQCAGDLHGFYLGAIIWEGKSHVETCSKA
jgi:hypothetical protein